MILPKNLKKNLNVLMLILVFISSIYGVSSFAADSSGFGMRSSLSFGIGKMYNDSKSIAERSVNSLELNVLPGYKAMGFLFGPFLAYRIVGQSTEPSEVNNQNVKGSGYLLGGGTTYTLNQFSFYFAVTLLGKYGLSNKDISGNEVYYQKPLGFHLGSDFSLSNWFKPFGLDTGAGIYYSLVKYKEDKVGNSESDVSKDKRTQWNLALSLSLFI